MLDRHNVIALGKHIDQLREMVHREAAVRVAFELRLHARQRHVFAAPHRVMKDEHVLRGEARSDLQRMENKVRSNRVVEALASAYLFLQIRCHGEHIA